MQYIYTALLLHKSGKEVNEENIKKVLEATGMEADESKVKTLVASLQGVDIDKALEEAKTMALATSGGAGSAKAEAEEEKKEEKKSEPAAEGLSALFG